MSEQTGMVLAEIARAGSTRESIARALADYLVATHYRNPPIVTPFRPIYDALATRFRPSGIGWIKARAWRQADDTVRRWRSECPAAAEKGRDAS